MFKMYVCLFCTHILTVVWSYNPLIREQINKLKLKSGQLSSAIDNSAVHTLCESIEQWAGAFFSRYYFMILSLVKIFLTQGWEFAHSLICSFRSNQMSDHERYALRKWANERFAQKILAEKI